MIPVKDHRFWSGHHGAMAHSNPGSQTIRHGIQGAFLALCAWIGIDFARFLGAGRVPHPAGAEGFLPISALLSLKFCLVTGRVHGFHPAGCSSSSPSSGSGCC